MEFWQTCIESPTNFHKSKQWHLYRDVLYYLAQQSGDWALNDVHTYSMRGHTQEMYDMIANMLKLENMESGKYS